ncbi:melibiose:sodium transporter MelB [Photobacterium gaetbulicola]|uniref:Melibiose:sodium symporter n=1 Tax=Photobacterium gaetbulicola Gung47 TaxID=658445 RepID=A0A0C5W1W6_9GAMM|nr:MULTISPECIES: melibiose:sodium transporter MelB [Photobacterium]AJR05336.1 melibiose:sodium symporter [Photobacterium gaetbulicola Gung47]PSU12663.1 melibiose:sodium transporter MelB [Photobacterium gaetbulicola]WEM44481.1 melibiose:sodium transporter MelB [Photobacterium sp. DA100]
MSEGVISLKTKVSYGLGALGKDFACSIIYIFLMFYYTDVAGIPAAFVGTLFLVARFVDAVTDPIMGMVVDNTRSRFGKFRPWIVIGTLVNSVFLVMVFSTHYFEGMALYVYATVTYILWGITYTIMDIPYWSMIPSMSKERAERERLVVWPRLFASFAWMLMGTYGLYVVGFFGGEDKGSGFLYLSLAIVVAFIASALITFFNVKEVIKDKKVTTEKFSLHDVKKIISENDQLKSLIGVVLSFNIAIQLVGGFAIYYFTYAIGREDLFPMFALLSGVAEIAGVFLFPRLCNIINRKHMWLVACGFPMLCSVVLIFTGLFAPENGILVGVAGAALKFGGGLSNGLSTVMLADVVDYGEYKTGHRSESIIFSVQTMLVKFAGALSGFFVGIGLTMIGYVPNVEQAAETILGLRILMIGIPTLLVAMSAFIYVKTYKLNGEYQRMVVEKITAV